MALEPEVVKEVEVEAAKSQMESLDELELFTLRSQVSSLEEKLVAASKFCGFWRESNG